MRVVQARCADAHLELGPAFDIGCAARTLSDESRRGTRTMCKEFPIVSGLNGSGNAPTFLTGSSLEANSEMTTSWIHDQTDRNIAQFDTAMENHYPEAGGFIRDPALHVARICEECNYLDAVKKIEWADYLTPGCSILDIGCGGGWLSGYLSGFDSVKTIYALDSSRRYLSEMMPRVVDIMGGRPEKIQTIEGLFAPLLFPDASLDIVVAASAVHHADNLEQVLREIRRVIRNGGLLFLLNEAPTSRFGHVYLMAKSAFKALVRSSLGMYKPVSQAVSSSGFLSNPLLGDREYPFWYWREAINRSGFAIVKHMDTGLPAVKAGGGPSLEHFVCKAV